MFVGALVLLFGGFATLGGYLWSLNSKIDGNVKHDKTFLPPDTEARAPRAANAAMNFLFIGSDAFAGDVTHTALTGSRSDTIMIAHVTADRDKIYLVSFPRDSSPDTARTRSTPLMPSAVPGCWWRHWST